MDEEPREERSLRLPDGRSLGYAEYGRPTGPLLLFLHGLPGSRRFRVPAWASGAFRVVVPDRPGFGRSDFQPGRRLTDYATDMRALADHLDVRRAHVAGVSGGGPHALSVAHGLGDRIAAVALLSGAGPLDTPERLAGLDPGNRRLFSLASRHPRVLQLAMTPMVSLSKLLPARLAAARQGSLPAADQAVLRDPEAQRSLLEASREAIAQGAKGLVHETHMLVQPWGFELADVRQPVSIWQGTDDHNVPHQTAGQLAAALPDTRVHLLDGEGHLLLFTHWAEIEAELLALG